MLPARGSLLSLLSCLFVTFVQIGPASKKKTGPLEEAPLTQDQGLGPVLERQAQEQEKEEGEGEGVEWSGGGLSGHYSGDRQHMAAHATRGLRSGPMERLQEHELWRKRDPRPFCEMRTPSPIVRMRQEKLPSTKLRARHTGCVQEPPAPSSLWEPPEVRGQAAAGAWSRSGN